MTDIVDTTKPRPPPSGARQPSTYVPAVGDRPEGTRVLAARAVRPRRLRPGHRLRHRLRPRRARVQRQGAGGLEGAARGRAARSPTPTATAACGCRSRTTPCTRSPTTPRTSPAAPWWSTVGRPGDLALPAPIGGAPPITSDPPFHNLARRLLLPPFAPKQIEPWEPEIRALCHKLLDEMGDDRHPARPSSTPPCSTPSTSRSTSSAACSASRPRTKSCSASSSTTSSSASTRRPEHQRRLRRPRQLHPRPGRRTTATTRATTSPATCSTSRSTAQAVNDDIVGGMIILLLVAGIDTTWSAIGSSLWHLAQHPEDQQRLVDDPEVMTFALEEFLRAYAPVTMARMVAKDIDFHGCPMKKDDWVLLPFPAANRDPHMFEEPDTFIIDRAGEPPRRLRARHPPLPRLEPRPARAEGRDRGVRRALPALRARRRRPLERRPGPRPA